MGSLFSQKVRWCVWKAEPYFQGHRGTLKCRKYGFRALSSEPLDGFWPTCIDTLLVGGEELKWFWWPWPFFQGHYCTLKCPKFGFCALSSELMDGFSPKIHYWENGNRRLDFVDLDLIFKVTAALWNIQNMVSVRCLLNKSDGFDHTRIDILLGEGELLIRFWGPWPNFKVTPALWNGIQIQISHLTFFWIPFV